MPYASKKPNRQFHGGTGTRLYATWNHMRERCFNPSLKCYKNYGGRGITVCSEWSEFGPFWKWAVTNGYRDGLELDRKDNDGPYSPGNCRWTSRSANCQNKRKKPGCRSKFIGVSVNRGRWIATICRNGKKQFLGFFLDELAAAKAYDTAARKLYGSEARTNFYEKDLR